MYSDIALPKKETKLSFFFFDASDLTFLFSLFNKWKRKYRALGGHTLVCLKCLAFHLSFLYIGIWKLVGLFPNICDQFKSLLALSHIYTTYLLFFLFNIQIVLYYSDKGMPLSIKSPGQYLASAQNTNLGMSGKLVAA